jgi:hypothetical protein
MRRILFLFLSICFFIIFTGCDDDSSNNENSFCGDGEVNQTAEACDGTDFAEKTCENLGYYGGELTCDENCNLNISDCVSFGECGDNVIQDGFNEICDGTDFAEKTCENLGYYGGELSCDGSCSLDISDCVSTGECGDGVVQIDFNEICDGSDLNGDSCVNHGYYGGELSCDASCGLIYTDCESYGSCGDNLVQNEFGEQCDGSANCSVLGYLDGSASCDSSCSADISSCNRFYQWGNSTNDYGEVIDVDLNGNFFVAGYTLSIIDGNENLVLTKFDPLGNILWSKDWSTAYDEYAKGVVVDSSGNVYVSGTQASSMGNYNMILLKFTNDGTIIWEKNWGTVSVDEGRDVKIDSSGNVFVVGFAYGSVNGETHIGQYDVVLTKFSPDGTVLFTTQWGSTGNDYGEKLSIDATGSVFVAGSTSGVIVGPDSGSTDMFLTRLSNDGTIIWSRQYGTGDIEMSDGVFVNTNGFIYTTGKTSGTMEGVSHGSYDLILTKFTDDGSILYTKQWGSDGYDQTSGVIVHSDGSIYVTGSVFGSLDENIFFQNYDIFLTKFSDDGSKIWSKQWGTIENDKATDLVEGINGNIYIAGYTDGVLPENITSNGYDQFIMSSYK